MAESSNGRYLAAIVNFIGIGVLTLVFGIWLLKVQREQDTLADQMAVIEQNQKKIAEAINSGKSANRQLTTDLEVVTAKTKSFQEFQQKSVRSEELLVEATKEASDLASEAKEIADALKQDRESLKRELVDLIRGEFQSQSTMSPSTSSIPVQSNSQTSPDDTSEFIEKTVRGVAKTPFSEIYSFPGTRGRPRGFYFTDMGEAFFVDRSKDTIARAWDNDRKDDYVKEVSDALSDAFRYKKKELEKAILSSVSPQKITEFRAKSLSESDPVELISVKGRPGYKESECTILAILGLGEHRKEFYVDVPYTKVPGVQALGISQQTVGPGGNGPGLSDDQIFDVISKQFSDRPGPNKLYVFPAGRNTDLTFVETDSHSVFVIDSKKDIVLPIHSHVARDDALYEYQFDFKEVVRDTIESAISDHRMKLESYLLRKNATTASTLETRSLSGNATAVIESIDIDMKYFLQRDVFPVSFALRVKIKAGSLEDSVQNQLNYSELPNMRQIEP